MLGPVKVAAFFLGTSVEGEEDVAVIWAVEVASFDSCSDSGAGSCATWLASVLMPSEERIEVAMM